MRLLFALALLVSMLAFGCTPPPEATGGANVSGAAQDDHEHNIVNDDDDATEDEDEPGDKDDKDDAEGDDKDDAPVTELAVYRNDEGKIMCPVMNAPIESEDKAFSHTDYKGKRYYFCCDGCPTVFDKNKDEYAK
jgi:YHS domain-containing protein